jgi:hypothetical protein
VQKRLVPTSKTKTDKRELYVSKPRLAPIRAAARRFVLESTGLSGDLYVNDIDRYSHISDIVYRLWPKHLAAYDEATERAVEAALDEPDYLQFETDLNAGASLNATAGYLFGLCVGIELSNLTNGRPGERARRR